MPAAAWAGQRNRVVLAANKAQRPASYGEGTPIRLPTWRRVSQPTVDSTGLGHLTPHDLRHTAASLAIGSGASVKHVQRMLGHKDASMTLNVYASLFEDDLDAVSDRLDAAWLDASAASVRPAASQDHSSLSIVPGQTGSD